MGLITVDLRDRKQLYEQLIDNVKNLILMGELSPDEKLPSVRSLARELGINPNTIQKAYAELERQGVIITLPGRGSVVTSKTGAVIRDIINVSTRRYPNANIKLYPAAVQGPDAYKEIVNAIENINKFKLADVIIVGRGGGSLEDLWNFNKEEVAYAIYNSEIPVVSAVGHETDFTIADFVADLRAPTPSAAAELVFPDKEELEYKIKTYQNSLKKSLVMKLEKEKKHLKMLKNSYCFKRPEEMLSKRKIRLDELDKRIGDSIKLIIEKKKNNFDKAVCSLDALSPLKTLARGYSVPIRDGKVIKSVKDLNKEDVVQLVLSDGNVDAKIM